MPKAVREQLAQGEWHMTGRQGVSSRSGTTRKWSPYRERSRLQNGFDEQPLKFRLQVTANSRQPATQQILPLLRSQSPVEVRPPATSDAMPGALVQRVELSKAVQDQGSVLHGRAQ